MQIAILGGSFDPPHIAHVQIIAHLIQLGSFDEIWVIPSCQHPFKKPHASFEKRLQMCQLAFAAFQDQVKIKDSEKTLSGYTIDLIELLKKQTPSGDFHFILGSDLKDQIKDWKDADKLKKCVRFYFLPRAPLDPSSPFTNISSTELREKIKMGQETQHYLHPKVAKYIQQHHLYR